MSGWLTRMAFRWVAWVSRSLMSKTRGPAQRNAANDNQDDANDDDGSNNDGSNDDGSHDATDDELKQG